MKCVFRAISYEYYGVSNHRLLDSFFKSLFKHMEETNQSPASLALCEGIPRVIGPPQRANIAESCSCHDVIWYGTTLVWVTDGPSVQRIFPLMQVYMLSKINGLRKAARVIDIVCSFVLVKAKWWWYSNNNDNNDYYTNNENNNDYDNDNINNNNNSNDNFYSYRHPVAFHTCI